MSKNLLTKFRKFWRTLSPLEQGRLWEILCALRGEDEGETEVKARTTARIRGLLLGKKLGHTMIGFFRPNPIKNTTITQRELFKKASLHFQSHIRLALHALKPYVRKEKFKDLLRFM